MFSISVDTYKTWRMGGCEDCINAALKFVEPLAGEARKRKWLYVLNVLFDTFMTGDLESTADVMNFLSDEKIRSEDAEHDTVYLSIVEVVMLMFTKYPEKASRSALADLIKSALAKNLISKSYLKLRLENYDFMRESGVLPSTGVDAFRKKINFYHTVQQWTQPKYNIIMEENEGYARLLTTLHDFRTLQKRLEQNPNFLHNHLRIMSGTFSLDPNRMLDFILDGLENLAWQQDATEKHSAVLESFLRVIGEHVNGDLIHLMGFKFQFYARTAKNCPPSLYYITCMLIEAGAFSMEDLYGYLSPSDESWKTHTATVYDESRKAARRLGLSVLNADEDTGMVAFSSHLRTGTPVSGTTLTITSAAASVLSFPHSRSPTRAKDDDAKVYTSERLLNPNGENQKLELGAMALRLGYRNLSNDILVRAHQTVRLTSGAYPPVRDALLALVAEAVGESPPVRLGAVPSTHSLPIRQYLGVPVPMETGVLGKGEAMEVEEAKTKSGEGGENTCPLDVDSNDVPSLFPVLIYLGPFLSASPVLFVRVVKKLGAWMSATKEWKHLLRTETDSELERVLTRCLMPALSLLGSNAFLNVELWSILKRFDYTIRYRLYYRWKDWAPSKHPELLIGSALARSGAKKLLRRMSKETVRKCGRLCYKLSNNYPIAVGSQIIEHMKQYDGIAQPFVDGLRTVLPLSLDVLVFELLSTLSSFPDKLSSDGLSIHPALKNLATLLGLIYRRVLEKVDLTPIVQYVLNQLKAGESADLVILQQLISKMAGIDYILVMSESQMKGYSGSPKLRELSNPFFSTIGSVEEKKKLTRATQTLKRVLLRDNLDRAIVIGICKQLDQISYETDFTQLKCIGNLHDMCLEVLFQYAELLHDHSILTEELGSPKGSTKSLAIPKISLRQLLHDFKLSPECAFHILRPYLKKIYADVPCVAGERKLVSMVPPRKVEEREEGEHDSAEEGETCEEESDEVMPDASSEFPKLQDELVGVIPPNVSPALALSFWSLSLYDIYFPKERYKEEISRQTASMQRLEKLPVALEDDNGRAKPRGEVEREKEARRAEIENVRNHIAVLEVDLPAQERHCAAMHEELSKIKGNFFGSQGLDSTYADFLQSCIIPRVLFSGLDSLFAAKFILILHQLDTPNFFTISLVGNLVKVLPMLVLSCTEVEAQFLGNFFHELMSFLFKWRCTPVEVCKDEFLKKSVAHVKNKKLSFDNFCKILEIWSRKLTDFFTETLKGKSLYYKRCSLLFLNHVVESFPYDLKHCDNIIQAVSPLVSKDVREDVMVLAKQYLIKLKDQVPRIQKMLDSAPPPPNASNSNNAPPAARSSKSGAGQSAAEAVTPAKKTDEDRAAANARVREKLKDIELVDASKPGAQSRDMGASAGSKRTHPSVSEAGSGAEDGPARKRSRPSERDRPDRSEKSDRGGDRIDRDRDGRRKGRDRSGRGGGKNESSAGRNDSRDGSGDRLAGSRQRPPHLLGPPPVMDQVDRGEKRDRTDHQHRDRDSRGGSDRDSRGGPPRRSVSVPVEKSGEKPPPTGSHVVLTRNVSRAISASQEEARLKRAQRFGQHVRHTPSGQQQQQQRPDHPRSDAPPSSSARLDGGSSSSQGGGDRKRERDRRGMTKFGVQSNHNKRR